MSSVPTPAPENEVTQQHSATWSWDGDETHLYRGRVKWFQPRKGFGFITLRTGETNEDGTPETTDIFVYHKGLKVAVEQYRYLMEGEYVEFNLGKSDNTSQVCQAVNVRGIDGGMLMCETQNERNLLSQQRSPPPQQREWSHPPRRDSRRESDDRRPPRESDDRRDARRDERSDDRRPSRGGTVSRGRGAPARGRGRGRPQ
jgi:cold shock CspA family protein